MKQSTENHKIKTAKPKKLGRKQAMRLKGGDRWYTVDSQATCSAAGGVWRDQKILNCYY